MATHCLLKEYQSLEQDPLEFLTFASKQTQKTRHNDHQRDTNASNTSNTSNNNKQKEIAKEHQQPYRAIIACNKKAWTRRTQDANPVTRLPRRTIFYTIMMHSLMLVLLVTVMNASFLRSNTHQQQQQQRNLHSIENLDLFGLNASHFCCPEKLCQIVSYFKTINPNILETDTQCTSADNCVFACLYDNTTSTFVCEESLLNVEKRCNLLCVKNDCDDDKMCLPFAAINDTNLEIECKGKDDCPFGECRYNNNTHKLLCDNTNSLCGYDCVENDEQEIP